MQIRTSAQSKAEFNRLKRKKRIRASVFGTQKVPRLTVYKSNLYLYAQVIDDQKSHTLVAVNSLQKDFKGAKNNLAGAKILGKALGDKLKEKKIQQVVFDRNGYVYHGVLAALVDQVRENGIRV